MNPQQEYQITECVRELANGATPQELRNKRYAEGAIQAAIKIRKAKDDV